MSLSKTESSITKIIFLQRIFRFASRTPKDLVIINFVCKDFEETMQAHHTFNLALYDNIIKKRHQEEDFLKRSVKLLFTAPAWIVFQWTTVNEHDETQRNLLKAFLLYQAKNRNEILTEKNLSSENSILIRDLNFLKNKENPSTTRELLRHILDSCVWLGIVKEVIEPISDVTHVYPRPYILNCIIQAVSRKMPVDSFRILIESCAPDRILRYTVLMKRRCTGGKTTSIGTLDTASK